MTRYKWLDEAGLSFLDHFGSADEDSTIQALLRIRNRTGHTVPLEPNAVQRAFARQRGQKNIVLKARQMGITTWVAARFFLRTITHPGTLTVQVAHDQQSAEEIFRIVHRFAANLPRRLREGAAQTSRANVRQIVFPRLDSEYRVETAADPQAGRGLTIQNLHCSEVARWPRDPAETLAGLRAAVAPAGEIVLESTPNGAGGCFYEEWQRASETGYVQHFFPWWMEPQYVAMPVKEKKWTDEERALAVREGLTPEQIGFRRAIVRSFRALAAQEYAEDPESCFAASGSCWFDAELLGRLLHSAPEPLESRKRQHVDVWYPPVKGKVYLIGADPAGGNPDGDYCCAQVLEQESGVQCAELHGHFAPEEFARRLARLACEYNQALIAVERNNHGHGVLAALEIGEKYPFLYVDGNLAGWLTTTRSRAQMLALLDDVLHERSYTIGSKRLLRECRSFLRRPDGSGSAAAGAYDDCVMAMAIALAVRNEQLTRGRPPEFASFQRAG